MRGKKSDYIPCTFRLSPRVVEILEEYSDSTCIPKTSVVELALRHYFQDVLGTDVDFKKGMKS